MYCLLDTCLSYVLFHSICKHRMRLFVYKPMSSSIAYTIFSRYWMQFDSVAPHIIIILEWFTIWFKISIHEIFAFSMHLKFATKSAHIRPRQHSHEHKHTYAYAYNLFYVFVFVCVGCTYTQTRERLKQIVRIKSSRLRSLCVLLSVVLDL